MRFSIRHAGGRKQQPDLAFWRGLALEAPQQALARLEETELEARHRAGYERRPAEPGEFSDWHDEQVWPD